MNYVIRNKRIEHRTTHKRGDEKMKEAKFIKKVDGLAEYEIDESNKEVADTKQYKAEKIKIKKEK